jgi:hypothetical protein
MGIVISDSLMVEAVAVTPINQLKAIRSLYQMPGTLTRDYSTWQSQNG